MGKIVNGYDVRYANNIGGTATLLFLKQAADLIITNKWFAPSHVPGVSYDLEAVYAIDTSGIIGALSFERQKWNRSFDIAWGFVRPDYRGRQLYDTLYEVLCRMAARDGYAHVTRRAWHTNTPMIKAIERQGGQPMMISFYADLRQYNTWSLEPSNVLQDRYEIV